MSKKVLSMLLALIIIISAVGVCAEEESNITVFLSLSQYGELVKDKNGESMAYVEVSLNGKSIYNLDDVFLTAHGLYYETGEEGYGSSESEWGLGIDKLWGDTSGNFGYQINSGTETVMGLTHTVEDGDYIDACIYKNLYPDTEGYSMFDMTYTEAYTDSEFELTLNYFSGYDENWNNIISPCEGAIITVNGEETDFVTDENGKVLIKLENEGRNIISAIKEKTLNEEDVPAITAPVCVVDTKASPAIEIIHNIAQQYTQIDFSQSDVNLPWIIADMLMYEELFADSEYVLNESQKQDAAKLIAESAIEAEKPGDLAKYILALRALGYDAKNVYTEDFETTDIVKKLTDLVDLKDDAVANIYTIPYVIIALSQDDGYVTGEQFDWLINSALESKDSWQSVENGTDALTPMILALAPYAETNDEIKNILDETVEILKSKQREDGLIDGFEGYEPASTGLAICALSAVGIDSDTVKNSENSLIYGLLSTANEELNGFSNAFATEQGFRGLLAWRLLAQNKGKIMYDFSEYPMNEANVSGIEYCPVVFDVSPRSAEVTIEGIEAFSENCFDLDAGEYEYTVSASGYVTETDEFEITAEEVEQHTLKTIEISLSRKYSGGGGSSGGGGVVASANLNNADTEKESEIKEEKNQQTEKNVFSEETFSDVNSDDWYYSAVQYAYENNLFNGTDKGFEPDSSMTRAMLVTVLYRLDSPEKVSENTQFSDVPENEWYAKSVNWAAENKIVNGVSDNSFAPNSGITREQFAVILYRYAMHKGYDTSAKDSFSLSAYSDKEKISEYAIDAINYVAAIGVMNGRTQSTIAPDESVTRAEVAAMLMRFAEVKN